MKFITLLLLFPISLFAQKMTNYSPSIENPYGLINPNAPKEVADYKKLIGICDCLSYRKDSDRKWGEPKKMTWTFKYILNGMAVQDETIKEDGNHTGSIRQFVADSAKWYVHWYSQNTPPTQLPTWKGNKQGDSIVLYKDQKAPNGMDGFSRLIFSEISNEGFTWNGVWTDTSESIEFPFWKIECKKRNRKNGKQH